MIELLAAISYPHLDPVIVRLGPVAVRWYGAAYLLGFLLAYLGLRRMARNERLRLSLQQLSDLLGWLVVSVLLGGRIGWWVVYHRDGGPLERWYEPLAIWHGGMSFHGALAGVALALVVWSWRRRVRLGKVADALALVAPVGLFLGRIANFINAELVGRPTGLPWGVIFPGEWFARHPSQLYEALLEGPLLLALLWAARRWASLREGCTAALFLILYGLFRFLVEFTRQPDEQIGFVAFGWLTMGQLLSVGLLLFGIALALALRIRPRKPMNPEPALPRSYDGRTI